MLSACNKDSSSATGAGTDLESDGGSPSSKYAGKYSGQIVGKARASGVGTSNFSEPISLTVNKNGTLSMTVDGNTVSGVMNNNKMETRIKYRIRKSWGSCDTIITLKGTVAGRRMDGPISGSGDCRYLGLPRKATLSGNFTSTRR